MRAPSLDEKLACERGDRSAAIWCSLLSGKPTDVASMQHDGTFINLSLQQNAADMFKPTDRQASAVDCNLTTCTRNGSLVTSALNWSTSKAWALNSALERPHGNGGLGVAFGTLSLLPNRKAASLELSGRRPGLLGGGISRAKLEAVEGEGLFLTVGPKFSVKGGTLVCEAQTDVAHRSHLHLGMRLGKPPQLQKKGHRGKLPGRLAGTGKWKGRLQQNVKGLPQAREAFSPAEARCTFREWLYKLQPPQNPVSAPGLEAFLEAFQTGRHDQSLPPEPRPTAADCLPQAPSGGNVRGLQKGQGPPQGAAKRAEGAQSRGGGIDAGCWLPAGSKGFVRWKAHAQRVLPFNLTAAIGMQTTGKRQEQQQREVRLQAPVARGLELAAEVTQQPAGRGCSSGLRLTSNRKGQTKWHCAAYVSPSRGLQLSGKFGKEVISPWLHANCTTDNLAGRFSLSMAPSLRLSRLSFAACIPL